MNKLQLYIAKSLRGFKSLVNLNPSEDVRAHVHDIRHALEGMRYDPDEKNIFYAVTYTDEGTFFIIVRTIPHGHADHLAAWIYIPADTVISADQLNRIVKLTTDKVSGSGVSNEDLAELREAFATEYDTDREAPSIAASQGTEFACHLYGGDTGLKLTDFMGARLFRPDSLPYAGFLIVDADLGIDCGADDITNTSLSDNVAVMPPEPTEEGFMPHIYRRPFVRPYLAMPGQKLAITWRRPGFEDVVEEVTVTADGMTPGAVSTAESRKAISPASFYVSSQATKEPLMNCTIKVNNVEITEAHYFTSAELANASVSITADGFFPYNGRLDLASTTQALIQLQERRKIYRFELPLKSTELGAPIKFEIRSKRPIDDSPIDGYKLLGDIQEGSTRTNHLGYINGTDSRSLITRGIWMLIGLVAGVLITSLTTYCSRDDSAEGAPAITVTDVIPEIEPEAPAAKPVASVPPTAPVGQSAAPADSKGAVADAASVAAAVKYLDANKVWRREEMEAIAALRGLYDDMNSYNFERLTGHWNDVLGSSSNFALVAKAARQSTNKKVNVRKATHAPTYNKPDDTAINWRGYTFWVDP